MKCSSQIDEPRKPSNGTLHCFRELAVIMTDVVISDCYTVKNIPFRALAKEGCQCGFMVLKNGSGPRTPPCV